MMRTISAAVLATIVATSGIGGVRAMQNAEVDGPKEAVMSFVRANEKGDVALTVDTFAEDATVFLPAEPPQRATGKAAIREAFQRTYARRNGPIAISLSDVSVQPFGDTAIVTAHLGPVPTLPVTQPTTVARRTFVLRRHGTRWFIVHLHASNVLLSPPK